MGSIGAEVAVRARALGATVTGVRRHPVGDEPVDRMVLPPDLPGVLPEADVVVISAPASASTHHLVDAAFLAAMAPGSLLVNVGRGELVDEGALIAALDRGRPAAAVLDVTAVEPLPADNPLWSHPRVVITPHVAGQTGTSNARYLPLVLDNLGRYRAGEPLRQERTLADWRT
jgi:phosphoglycerate dehydrogenase-like enzyme